MAELLPKVIKENKQIIFNGSGYQEGRRKPASASPQPEEHRRRVAAARHQGRDRCSGLRDFSTSASCTRYEIMVETYNKTVNVEGQLMVLMANRYILPAAFSEERGAERVGGEGGGQQVGRGQEDARRTDWLVDIFKQRTDKLASAEHEGDSAEKHASTSDIVVPAMSALRETGDQLG